MSACAACGIDNAPGAKYCKTCGVPMQSVASVSVSTAPQATRAHSHHNSSQATGNPPPVASPPQSTTVSTKATSNQGFLANTLVVAFVLIVGYYYMSSGNDGATPAEATKIPAPSVDAKARDQARGSAKVHVASEADRKTPDNRKQKSAVAPLHETPPPVATPGDAGQTESKEAGVLINRMIEGSSQNAVSEITALKTRIEALPKFPKGDRKVARGLNYEAIALLRDNKFAEAASILEKAAAADPSDVEVIDNLGYAALKEGNLIVAKRSSYAALAIAPGRSSAWASLGVVLAQTETEEQAVAAFSNAYRFSGNTGKTVEYFEKLAAEDPNPKVKRAAAKALEVVKTFQ